MKYLNLGCGQRYHPEWTNINFLSTNEGVISHDLRQGIPFPDRSFDVVYHSHVLEHLSKSEASKFLKECSRVLRPQGVLRVVVPDLEEIANNSSEQALRLSVIFRKVTNGFRSDWGKNLFAAVRSIVNTGKRQGLSAFEAIKNALSPPPSLALLSP